MTNNHTEPIFMTPCIPPSFISTGVWVPQLLWEMVTKLTTNSNLQLPIGTQGAGLEPVMEQLKYRCLKHLATKLATIAIVMAVINYRHSLESFIDRALIISNLQLTWKLCAFVAEWFRQSPYYSDVVAGSNLGFTWNLQRKPQKGWTYELHQ